MTTYYVDGTNGSNSNNGLSPTSAFLTIQKFATVMSDGDTCKVFGENTYTTSGGFVTLNVNNVTVEQYETDGTDRPIIDALGGSASCIRVDGATGVTIRRMHMINATANGLNHANAVDGGLIDDCIVEDCASNGFASFATATGTVTYKNCRALNNTGDGFSQRGAQIVKCYSCYSGGHTGLNVSDGFTSHDTGYMEMYNCISVGNRHGVTFTASGAHVIRDFIANGSIENAIRFTTAAGTLDVDRACLESGTSFGVRANIATITIKNSLIVIPSSAAADSVGIYVDDLGTVNAYNCVIMNYAETNTAYSFGSIVTATGGTFKNNISYCPGATARHWNANAAGTVDYNGYFPDGTLFYFGGTGYTFSNWQALNPGVLDASSEVGNDPGFKRQTETVPNFTNCELLSSSSNIASGDDLSGTFTTDCRRKTRTAWDKGCHAYSFQRNHASAMSGSMMLSDLED